MGDRELLELAAKAANVPIVWVEGWQCFLIPDDGDAALSSSSPVWNPLGDNGDAMLLAVNLGLAVIPYPIYAKPKHSVIVKVYDHSRILRGEMEDVRIEEIELYGDDAEAATRRCITRAAAGIGKTIAATGAEK